MPYGLDMPHMYVQGLIFSQSKQSLQDEENRNFFGIMRDAGTVN